MEIETRRVAALALVLGVALTAGCSNDDDGGGPENPGTPQFNEHTAEAAGLLVAEQLDNVFAAVPTWASGDLAGGYASFGVLRSAPGGIAGGDTAVYVPAQQAYVYDRTIITVTASDSTHIDTDLWAQFLTKGVPHEARDDWDHIDMTLHVIFLRHTPATPTQLGSDIHGTITVHFNIMPGPASPHQAVGGGTSSGSVTILPIGSTDDFPEYTFTFDVSGIEEGSCPSGTVAVNMGEYVLTATYNGGSEVPWVLKHDDDEVRSGSYLCGPG